MIPFKVPASLFEQTVPSSTSLLFKFNLHVSPPSKVSCGDGFLFWGEVGRIHGVPLVTLLPLGAGLVGCCCGFTLLLSTLSISRESLSNIQVSSHNVTVSQQIAAATYVL